MSSCRLADDDVVGLRQSSKAEAQCRKHAMAAWLQENLGLTQHPEKTQMTHGDDRLRCLGDEFRGQRTANGTRWVRWSIPPEKARALKAKGQRLCRYTQMPELDLFMSVNALMRGWANSFRYANNATNRFSSLTGVVSWLVAHSLGRQPRGAMPQAMRTAYGVDPTSGKRALYTRKGGKRVDIWHTPPQRQSRFSGAVGAKDVQPFPMMGWARGRSSEQRVEARQSTGQRCQHCGTTTQKLLVHHPNRLGQHGQRKQGPANVIASGAEQRVKLLCPGGHKQHHPGGWHKEQERSETRSHWRAGCSDELPAQF
jgi:hypothetical protein